MERVKGFFQHISLYIIALAKWLCIGGGVGLIGGVVGAAFHIGVEQATELRLAQPWIIWLLPVGGVVIVGLYRLAHMEGRGTNNIIESVHFGKDVPILLVPLIFISTCITHLLGGSAGREGAAVAYLIASLFGVSPTRFAVTLPALDVWTVFLVVLLAIGCALVSILFVRGMHWVEHMAVRFLKNSYLRAAAGGFAIIGLTLLLGRDYNGAGMDIIARAVEQGEAAPWAWFLKILFTALTIGCGFKGGEVVPSFFVGATFGCVAGQALGLPGGFGAAIGLVAVFCGAVNCPIASVILSIELFGSGGLVYFAAACALSYLLSGYCGLYSSQTILYSKLKAEFINVHTHE